VMDAGRVTSKRALREGAAPSHEDAKAGACDAVPCARPSSRLGPVRVDAQSLRTAGAVSLKQSTDSEHASTPRWPDLLGEQVQRSHI
jgi:hypothetical protein